MQATYNTWAHTFQIVFPEPLPVGSASPSCITHIAHSAPCSPLVKARDQTLKLRVDTAKRLNAMLDEHDFSLESTPWSTRILFAILSAVALVAILASLYLAVRVRWLSIAVATLQQTQPTYAFKIVTPFRLFPTSPKPTPTSPPNPPCPHDVPSYFIAAVAIAVIALLLYKYWNRRRSHTMISLELSSQTLCAHLPIAHVPICPKHFHYQASSWLQNITIEGYLSPQLSVDWQDLQITNLLSEHDVPLPKTIRTNPLQALKLRKILAGPFHSLICAEHAQRNFYVQVCLKPCTHCPSKSFGMLHMPEC